MVISVEELERWYEFGRIDWVSELEYPDMSAEAFSTFIALATEVA